MFWSSGVEFYICRALYFRIPPLRKKRVPVWPPFRLPPFPLCFRGHPERLPGRRAAAKHGDAALQITIH